MTEKSNHAFPETKMKNTVKPSIMNVEKSSIVKSLSYTIYEEKLEK
jgi:hypothetical protein